MSRRPLPAAVQAQAERTEAMDAEIASAATPPAPEPAAPAPEPAAPPAATAPTEDSWHHKFLTLQGKYNTETASLRTDVETLKAEIKALGATPAPTPEPVVTAPLKLVTDADTDSFGADLIDLMRRVAVETDDGAKAKLQAEIDALKSQLPTLTERVDTVTQATAADKRADYFVKLTELCPTWKPVNESDAFKGWLGMDDALSGQIRNDLLQTAYNAFDHVRTAVIFNTYVKETGSQDPAPVPATVPDPAAELAAQVSPAGGKAAVEIAPDDGKKIWSSTEVQTFFNDVARGVYRGRDADRARIDGEIDQALTQGRVTV